MIYDANIGYGGANGGHRSIPAANMAVELFAKTGAYEAVFSNDVENFKYDRIKKFDAVFLNNTVGQIFVDPEIRAGFSRFVREGGGLAGYHGTSHASMDWPEFGEILVPSRAATASRPRSPPSRSTTRRAPSSLRSEESRSSIRMSSTGLSKGLFRATKSAC